MGDEDQQQPPQPSPASPEPDAPGSPETDLHENPGSAAGMPEWADSLSQGVSDSRSKVDVDLAKRLKEEEARIARERAEAARRAREEAARRKAAEETARRQAAEQAAMAEAARPRSVPKWPSMLAALAVILLGAFVGQKILGSEEAPQQESTPFPIVSATPTGSAEAAAVPTAKPVPARPAARSNRLDTYTVKPGDTLESIATRFGRTPVEISLANGAYGGLIRVQPGQVINIP